MKRVAGWGRDVLSRLFRGPSWLERRPRGDAPVTCLAIIVGTIAAGVFVYYTYFQNASLEKAGTQVVVLDKVDSQSFNAYRIKMRDKVDPMVRTCGEKCRKAMNPVIRGKVTTLEACESELNLADSAMREAIDMVNSQGVPKQFSDMHHKYAKSIGANWKALVAVRKALKEDDKKLRKASLNEAKKELKKGRRLYTSAHDASLRMFD